MATLLLRLASPAAVLLAARAQGSLVTSYAMVIALRQLAAFVLPPSWRLARERLVVLSCVMATLLLQLASFASADFAARA